MASEGGIYLALAAAVGGMFCVSLGLNIVLVVMVLIRCCHSRDHIKNTIQSFVWLSLTLAEFLNVVQFIIAALPITGLYDNIIIYNFIEIAFSVSAIVYVIGLIILNCEIILRPILWTLRGTKLTLIGVGCCVVPWFVAITLVLSLKNKDRGEYIYEACLSIFNCVLNTLAIVLSCFIVCLPAMRRRYVSINQANARLTLALPTDHGSVNSGYTNTEYPEQRLAPGADSHRATVDNSSVLQGNPKFPETVSTLPRREDTPEDHAHKATGSNPTENDPTTRDDLEHRNSSPAQVMVSPQEETAAEETTSPQTPLLPQTDLPHSALDTNPKTESVKIFILTLMSAYFMFPAWAFYFVRDWCGVCYFLAIVLPCARSLVLVVILILFLPAMACPVTGRFQYKIMF